MGYPQTTTTIVTDNSTASGIANDTIKQQRSRAIDMRYHWIRDRVVQGQFKVTWKPGKENKADYYTKHHAGAHHQRVRPQYLLEHCTRHANHACEGVLNPNATSSGYTASRPDRSHAQSSHWNPAGARAPATPAGARRPSSFNSVPARASLLQRYNAVLATAYSKLSQSSLN